MVLTSCTPHLLRLAGLADDQFPQNEEEADRAQKVLRNEFDNLSLDEHERLLFDIHGICSMNTLDNQEDEVFIKKKLSTLDDQLNKIHHSKKEAYELARLLNRTYVESPEFRIMFLRSENFNVKAAADTIISHFEIKRKIFGDGDVLAREVLQADVLKEHEDGTPRLEDGVLQVLPERDSAGRTVICANLGYSQRYAKPSPLNRAAWYTHMSIVKDVDAQRDGVVFLLYNYSQMGETMEYMRDVHLLRSALPQRTIAAHYCYTDVSLRPSITGLQLFIDPESRFRIRPHHGTIKEIEFQMLTYGIPTHVSPMQEDGTWDAEWHKEWLRAYRVFEEKEHRTADPQTIVTSTGGIIVPRKFDVLFGRREMVKTHTGNLRALHLCETYYPKYESKETKKFMKTALANEIVELIHESGGRFLKPSDAHGGWEEVDDIAAREKISHYFRHMRHKSAQAKENDSSFLAREDQNKK